MNRGALPTLLLLLVPLAVAGCKEDERKDEDVACEAESECKSDYCLEGVCTRPDADLDGDGVINSLEVSLGLMPGVADSDGDGEADGREIGPAGKGGGQAFDCDGDGTIDALERQVITPSAGGDADNDTIPDEWDPDDSTPMCTGDTLAELQGETDQGCRTYGCRPKTHCELKAERTREDVRAHCADGPLSDRDETCDDIDDDCDGRVDEECDANCDGVDDDCDGLPDDDFGVPDCLRDGANCTQAQLDLSARWDCSPAAPGEEACLGRRVCERALPGAPPNEVCVVRRISSVDRSCDGVDDDCNGEIDDGYIPQVCGFGVCRGETVCNAGVQECPTDGVPPDDPETECNGLDDDCDGQVDEGFDPAAAPPCGEGACQAAPRCTLSGLECPPPPDDRPARDTTCDGVDDDCDGSVDEDWPGDGSPPTCGDPACPSHAQVCQDEGPACLRASTGGGDAREHAARPFADLVAYDLAREGLALTATFAFDGDIPTDAPAVPGEGEGEGEAPVLDPLPAYAFCIDNAPDAGDPASADCDARILRRWSEEEGDWSCAAESWSGAAWVAAPAVDVTCEVDLEEWRLTLDLAGLAPGCGSFQLLTWFDDAPLDSLPAPVELP